MRRPAVVLALVLLPLVACTGEDVPGADAGPTLEERREAYREQAEESCREANAELEALATPVSVETIPDYTDSVVDILTRTVQEVTAVEPPEEDEAELTERMLEPLGDDVVLAQEYARQVRAAADSGDTDTLLRLVQEIPQTSADLDFMREYELFECANAADTSTV